MTCLIYKEVANSFSKSHITYYTGFKDYQNVQFLHLVEFNNKIKNEGPRMSQNLIKRY